MQRYRKKNTAGRRDVLTFDNKLERVTEPAGRSADIVQNSVRRQSSGPV